MKFEKRSVYLIVTIILGGVALANWIVWNHAKRMIYFAPSGERTKSPEDLSVKEKLPLLIWGITVPRPENVQKPSDLGLSFNQFSVVSGEHTLEVWELDPNLDRSKSTVILFHGYAESKDSLLPLALSIYEMGHTAWLVDFRGSGGSTGEVSTIGYLESKDVAAVFTEAKRQSADDRIVLYGMSMGGAAVLRAVAEENIDPDGLILESVFDTMLTTVQNRFQSMGVPHFPAANLLLFWGGLEMGFNAFEHNPAEYARDVSTPTLVLHGEHDPRATLAEGVAIFESLAAQEKKLFVFENGGHDSGHQANKQVWEREAEAFLNLISHE